MTDGSKTADAAKSEFLYVTYIRTTPEKLWHALTTSEFMKQYWFGMACEADWRAGGSWRLVSSSGQVFDAGEIAEFDPPKHMAIQWRHEMKPELREEGVSRCVFDLETKDSAVKLTVRHTLDRPRSKLIEAVSGGWPQILSNLKSLLETGTIAVEPIA
jgi:uncharacterized protein YndB with AHSA1/START domain